MSVVAANVINNFSNTGATSYATASITPLAGVLYLATFASRTAITTPPNVPTASGAGLTWVLVNTVLYDDTSSSQRRVSVFRAMGTGSAGAITFDEGGQSQTSGDWSIDAFYGADTTGSNGANAVVQSVTNFDDTATVSTISAVLGTPAASSTVFGAVGSAGFTLTAGAGLTLLSSVVDGVSNSVGTEWASGGLATVAGTLSGNSEVGIIAIEIKNGAGLRFINGGASAATTTTIPIGHQGNDLLLMWAYNGASTTLPTVPAGWLSLGGGTGTTCSGQLGYRVAGSNAETSGTWTNATDLICLVYRGQATNKVPVSTPSQQTGTSTSVSYSGVAPMKCPGTSLLAFFSGISTANTALETPPTSTVFRANAVGTQEVAGFDTNVPLSVYLFNSVSVGGTSGNWISRPVEIYAEFRNVENYRATDVPDGMSVGEKIR